MVGGIPDIAVGIVDHATLTRNDFDGEAGVGIGDELAVFVLKVGHGGILCDKIWMVRTELSNDNSFLCSFLWLTPKKRTKENVYKGDTPL